MPGARQLVGEPGSEIDAEETRRIGVVVGVRAAAHALREEEPGDYEEVPDGRSLRRGESDILRRAEDDLPHFVLVPVPAELAGPAEGEHCRANARQQRDKR